MEWVETTAKTIDAAREVALDQLGVAADEAEIEIIEEPKAGLFGRVRGEARLRARIKPTPARAKQERRRRSKDERGSGSRGRAKKSGDTKRERPADDADEDGSKQRSDQSDGEAKPEKSAGGSGRSDREVKSEGSDRDTKKSDREVKSKQQEQTMTNQDPAPRDDRRQSDVTPQEVGDAAVVFMDGLTEAFGATGSAALAIDGTELEVNVTGEELGLLVGSGGRTLNAIQDLVRVAAQRRLGDHETRLRIDVAGYRERRQAALGKFARSVAEEVRASGEARSMEPMTSADRKVVHDVLNEEEGVESRSEGEDPSRRIIVDPAS